MDDNEEVYTFRTDIRWQTGKVAVAIQNSTEKNILLMIMAIRELIYTPYCF